MRAKCLRADKEGLRGIEKANVAVYVDANRPAQNIGAINVALIVQQRFPSRRVNANLSVARRYFPSLHRTKNLIRGGVKEKRLSVKIRHFTPYYGVQLRHTETHGAA